MAIKISKTIPNKFIMALDSSGHFLLNESGGKQYLFNLLTMENRPLMNKKIQKVLCFKEWMYILAESTITYRLNLITKEMYKYKRYPCNVFSSELIQTDSYIVRYDGFTHNIQLCYKENNESKVIEATLKQNQRISSLAHMSNDVCLALIVTDNKDYTSQEYEFMVFDIDNLNFRKIDVNTYIQKDTRNLYFTDMLYIKNLHIWFFKISNRILLLSKDLQEVLYEFNGNIYGFKVEGMYRYIEERNFILFEVEQHSKFYIMKLDLIKYTYTPLYQLDYYSPILYSSKLNKLIIGNSYNQRGGFDIIDMEIK